MELTSVDEKFFCIDKHKNIMYIVGIDFSNDSPYPHYVIASGRRVPMDITNLYFDRINAKIVCKLKRKII